MNFKDIKIKNTRIIFNAPVVLCLVTISLIATFLQYITFGASSTLLFMTYHSSLLSPLTWVRSLTHIFGHSSWSHFVGNMGYILILGPMLEEKYSSRTLVEVICITALCTSIVNYILFPDLALCGASGVVFAFILLSSFTNFKSGEMPITFILVAIFFIGQQIWDGLTVKDNISNMAHIVGGIIGGGAGYFLNRNVK